MVRSRYTKVVLAVFAAGLAALTFAQLGPRAEAASTSEDSSSAELLEPANVPTPVQGGQAGTGTRAATSTKPLRWRVAYARESAVGGDPFCATAVVVRNLSNAQVVVDVEWFDDNFVPQGALATLAVPAGNQRTFVNNDAVDMRPFIDDSDANTLDFDGFAEVFAADPRILVSAYLLCRDALGLAANLVSLTDIPTFPVGATLDFFRAGMPGMGAPLVTAPESLAPQPR